MSEVTPRYLAQQIIRLVERGDQSRDSQITEREVMALIVNVATKLLKQEMYALRQSPDGYKTIPSHLIKTYKKVPVKKLISTGVNYIDIPGDYASLPMNEGVRRIAPKTDNPFENSRGMIPVQHEEMDIIGNIIGSMQNQWVYFIEGSKAYFYKKCDKTLCESGINYVSVSLVSVSIDEDEPLQAPPELRYDIITSVLDLLQATYGISDVKDMVNDDNAQSA